MLAASTQGSSGGVTYLNLARRVCRDASSVLSGTRDGTMITGLEGRGMMRSPCSERRCWGSSPSDDHPVLRVCGSSVGRRDFRVGPVGLVWVVVAVPPTPTLGL